MFGRGGKGHVFWAELNKMEDKKHMFVHIPKFLLDIIHFL